MNNPVPSTPVEQTPVQSTVQVQEQPIQIQESLPVQVQETIPVQQQVVFEEPKVQMPPQDNLFTQPGGTISTPNNFFDNMIKENVQEPVQPTVQVQEQPQVVVQEQPQIIPTETNIPVQQNQTTVIQQPVQPENQTVKVDTQTTVVENNTDDEYFDDFFE